MKKWFMSLLAAFIGGGANTITLMVIDPLKFNLQDGWHNLVTGFVIGGILSVSFYLKQSPVPPDTDTKIPTPPLALFILLFLPFFFVGCAGSTPSSQISAIVAPTENVRFIQAVDNASAILKLGGQLALSLALDDKERVEYATYISGSGHLFESFQKGQLPQEEDVSNALKAYFPTTSDKYANIAQISSAAVSAAITIVKTYVPVSYTNRAEYINYCFAKLAKTAYEVADPYLE
jgi:hypothetical protein